jgi:hypothetical protein
LKRNDDARRIREYGLTPEDYEVMLSEQAGNCPLCLGDLDDPHIDHDHDVSEAIGYPLVRWVLCRGCNLLLGNAKDNPQTLLHAAPVLSQFYGINYAGP